MPTTPHSRLPFLAVLLSAVTLVVVLFIAGYLVYVQPEKDAARQLNTDLAGQITGLARPTTNKLDPAYTDADGDLLADAPTDPAALQNPPTLHFAYVATENPAHYQAVWKDFVDHLSKTTGKPVTYTPFTKSAQQIRAIKEGTLHVAGLNTGSVPPAVNLAGFIPAYRISAGSNSLYHMELITRAGSPVRTVADLKNRTLTLVDPSSNSGYRAPMVFLKESFNMIPERDYLTVVSFDHDKSILGIASGKYETAAVASDVLQRAVAAGKIKPDQYATVYKSETFPSAALGYAHNLHPDLAGKIREAFDTFIWADTTLAKEFAPKGKGSFVPANYKQDWHLVRRVDDSIGLKYTLK